MARVFSEQLSGKPGRGEHVAPVVAVALGGDPDAYRYLPRSVRAFPAVDRLTEMLRDARFARVTARRLTFGIAALHTAE